MIEMNGEEKKIYYMNRNTKLYPSFLALSWDIMFVWTISTMFFTNVKGLSYSQTIMLDSLLMIAGGIGALLVPKLFQKVDSVRSTRIGMYGYGAYLLICIFGNSYWHFAVAQFFLGFGYAVAGIKGNLLLTNSLKILKKDGQYQKIYGKGLSIFYIMEAVGSILITYVYDWKPIMCYWIAVAFVLAIIILTFFMKNPKKYMDSNFSMVEEAKESKTKPDNYFKILKSSFLIFLLLYSSLFRGILYISGSGFKIYMNQLIEIGTIPIWAFGYIYAGIRVTSAIMSKFQFKFDLKFSVRSLILFTTYAILSFVVCGSLYLINMTAIPFIIIVVLISYIQCSLRSPNQIFMNNYLQVCTKPKNTERAFSLKVTLEYIVCAATSAFFSLLLTIFNDNYGMTYLIYIASFALPLIISLTLFIRVLVKKFAQRYTIIKQEYTED